MYIIKDSTNQEVRVIKGDVPLDKIQSYIGRKTINKLIENPENIYLENHNFFTLDKVNVKEIITEEDIDRYFCPGRLLVYFGYGLANPYLDFSLNNFWTTLRIESINLKTVDIGKDGIKAFDYKDELKYAIDAAKEFGADNAVMSIYLDKQCVNKVINSIFPIATLTKICKDYFEKLLKEDKEFEELMKKFVSTIHEFLLKQD